MIKLVYISFEDEIWKPLIYRDIKPMYVISNYGRIRNNRTNKIIKSYRKSKEDTHLTVSLRLNSNSNKWNNKRTFNLHVLVASMFITNSNPNRKIVHHKDGDPMNNCVYNLMWVTDSEHLLLTYELEQRDRKYGDKSPNARYTTEQYTKLAKMLEENESSIRELSESTGISVNMIREFIHGNIIWPKARNKHNVENYTGLQNVDEDKMIEAFSLVSKGEYSSRKIAKMLNMKETTVANIHRHAVPGKWKYLYDKFDIPKYNTMSSIVVINNNITKNVKELIYDGYRPKEIIKKLKLPDNKSIYQKIYRLYSQIT